MMQKDLKAYKDGLEYQMIHDFENNKMKCVEYQNNIDLLEPMINEIQAKVDHMKKKQA